MALVSSFRQMQGVPGEASRVVKVDGVTYVVRVRREGVEPAAGWLLAYPVWAFTRLRWQLSAEKRWSVETTQMRGSGIGGTRMQTRLFRSRPDASAFAEAELERLRSSVPG